MANPASTGAHSSAPAWTPFRHRAFAVIWAATVVSNIGTWMYNAGSGWLMTTLDADPLMVSLVQVAASLPLFLFALPAGALADIVDRRIFLLVAEASYAAVAVVMALAISLGHVGPVSLLVYTFVLGALGALSAPAWQSVVPTLVPRDVLPQAIAANSVGINVSRAIGPALGGVVIGVAGIAAPFWFNALSNGAVIGALAWWRPPQRTAQRLPAERLAAALRAGLRYTRHSPALRATLGRAVAFFLFASAYWALLPLVARERIAGGPGLYGVLLGAIGAGAVLAAFALPAAKKRLGGDRMVAAGTIGTAVAMALFGWASDAWTALAASLVAGASWIAVLASLNVSAQSALPDWVRGRGLAMFVTAFYGAMTFGSAAWGKAAQWIGLSGALYAAAAGAIVAMLVTWRWKLHAAKGLDLTPSLHWPAPVVSREIEGDRGPVMVTVEYTIDPSDRDAFLAALDHVGRERRRDGAYAWGIFEDTADASHYVETFLVESWLEHLRQHERVTHADREAQDAVTRFQRGGDPRVTHLYMAERSS